MSRHRPLAIAVLLNLLGAGGALLIANQTWQGLSAARVGPFPNVQVPMIGRDVDSAITALALVALAGVVAVLAARGRWRRLVGAAVALAGVGMIVRAVLSAGAVDNARALSFILAQRQTVTVAAGTTARVEVFVAWPLLTVACGALVLAAGALIAARGGRWQGMSSRYEPSRPPADAAEEQHRAAIGMWSALDRGVDPTAR